MQSVGEILCQREAVGLPASASALEAAQRMHAERVGALLVFGPDGGLTGIFTERDLMTRVVTAGRDPGATTLREVMTPDPFTVDAAARIGDVRRELHERHIRHLPVTAAGKVVGVLSLRDLLHADLTVKENQVKEITSYIQGEIAAPEQGRQAE